jgi:hypothetical protein
MMMQATLARTAAVVQSNQPHAYASITIRRTIAIPIDAGGER